MRRTKLDPSITKQKTQVLVSVHLIWTLVEIMTIYQLHML
jgi:hypothetical protein